MSDNTYGSSNLRFESIRDISGKRIKKNIYFFAIYMTIGQLFMILISVIFGGIWKL